MGKEDITITMGGDIVDVSKEPHASVRRMQPGEMLVALFVGGEQKGSFTYRGMDDKFAWALSDAAGKLLSELHPGEDGEIQVHEPIISGRAGGGGGSGRTHNGSADAAADEERRRARAEDAHDRRDH